MATSQKRVSFFTIVLNWTLSDEFIHIFFKWKTHDFNQFSTMVKNWTQNQLKIMTFLYHFQTGPILVAKSNVFHMILFCDQFWTSLKEVPNWLPNLVFFTCFCDQFWTSLKWSQKVFFFFSWDYATSFGPV